MKVIKEFEHLAISGENLYHNADTMVYWNSVSQANAAQIVPNSFESESRLKVIVPCCLPEYNKLVICNMVGCHTGVQNYRYVGSPEIDTFSPTSQTWGQEVIVKGKYFEDVTGIFVGDTKVVDYNWPSKKKLIFEAPNGLDKGFITVYTKVASVTSNQILTGIRPDIQGDLINSPKYYGQSGIVEGKSLDSVNRIELVGTSQKIIYVDDSYLNSFGTTGLRFLIPVGTDKDSSVKLQNVSGGFVGGEYQVNIKEQTSLGNLNLKSVHIDGLDKGREAYQQPVRVSGVNLDKSKIFFQGYDGSFVEGPFVNSGEYYKTVSVPKNIKRGSLVASGAGGEYTGLSVSENAFYPLPTIFDITPTDWTMGQTVSIKAYNASNIIPVIGITGTNLINGNTDTFFVSNPDGGATYGVDYFGYTSIDNSELSTDTENGFTRITGVVNSVMAGSGRAFLIAAEEFGGIVALPGLSSELKNSYSYQNINKIIYPIPVNISGKPPVVTHISHPQSARVKQIYISGKYFLPLTGVELFNSTESKTLSRDSLLDINQRKVNIINSGQINNYEKIHYISMNVEDFGFSSKNGQFKILTP